MLSWIKIGIAAIIVTTSITYHVVAIRHTEERVNQKWISEQIKKDAANTKTHSEIVEAALQLEREKNEEISKLNASVSDLTKRLQNRPSRIEYRDTPRVEQACTGAELYREDGEFLAGEAARADRIRIERDYYFDQYEQARKKLNERNQAE